MTLGEGERGDGGICEKNQRPTNSSNLRPALWKNPESRGTAGTGYMGKKKTQNVRPHRKEKLNFPTRGML